jgi:hypothetical protein
VYVQWQVGTGHHFVVQMASPQLGGDEGGANIIEDDPSAKCEWTQLVVHEGRARVQQLANEMRQFDDNQRAVLTKLDKLMMNETESESNDSTNEDLFASPELARMEELAQRVPEYRAKLQSISSAMRQITRRAQLAENSALRLHAVMSERMLDEEARLHADRQTDLSLKPVQPPSSPETGEGSSQGDTAGSLASGNGSTPLRRNSSTPKPKLAKRKVKSKVVHLA